jgi:hypothetical protein
MHLIAERAEDAEFRRERRSHGNPSPAPRGRGRGEEAACFEMNNGYSSNLYPLSLTISARLVLVFFCISSAKLRVLCALCVELPCAFEYPLGCGYTAPGNPRNLCLFSIPTSAPPSDLSLSPFARGCSRLPEPPPPAGSSLLRRSTDPLPSLHTTGSRLAA